MDENRKKKIQALIDLHNEFAGAYKLVESLVDNMDATTLNDIRYALRAMVDCIDAVINEKSDEVFIEAVARAELSLRIAWCDVVDITFYSFRIYLDDLGKTFGADIVAKYIDMASCSELLSLYDEVSAESRRHRERRGDLYKQITYTHLKDLKGTFNGAKAAEPAITAAYKKERRDNALKIFGAIASLLILGTALYVNFIKEDPGQEPPSEEAATP